MGRTCTVCGHKDVEEINKQLLSGPPLRTIAAQFNLTKTSLIRHRESHIPDLLLKSNDIQNITSADALLARVEEEAGFVRDMREAAKAEGDIELALKAVDRALKCVDLYAKIRGLIQTQPQVNLQQVNIYSSPEWRAVGEVLARLLAGHPELKAAVAAELKALSEAQQ